MTLWSVSVQSLANTNEAIYLHLDQFVSQTLHFQLDPPNTVIVYQLILKVIQRIQSNSNI